VRALLDVSAVPDRPVGAGVYTINIARGLAARADVDLHLLTRRGDPGRWSAIAPTATTHALAPDRRPVRLAWEQARAESAVRAIEPDVWHGPHYTMPLRASVPAVVTVHDLTFFDHPEWHERTKVLYFRRMLAAAARRAAVLVCISEYTADRVRERLRPRGEIVVVPHGVDHDRFAPSADRAGDEALLAAHGIAPPYVGFAGTVEPRKDLPSLVRAFAQLAPTRPDLRLVLAGGDGWGAAALRGVIAGSGAATRILRPGYLDDATLTALFRRAAVVAYPSFEEGFGLPALEALACGTPLVTSRGSALEEVTGDAALLVAPGDVEALATAIAAVLDDPALADRLAAGGPPRAAAFTWDRSVAGHVDAYARAVGIRSSL
jgi:glycosyltransferase involved in cell wall biosynthesis